MTGAVARSILLGAVVIALAGTLAGQYADGDTIIAGMTRTGTNPGVLLGVRPGGAMYTVSTFPGSFVPSGVLPTPDNQSLWIMGADILSSIPTGWVYRMAPDGTFVSVSTIQGFHPSALDVEPGGTAVVTDQAFSSVVRLSASGVTTLYSGFIGGLQCGAIDLNTGGLVTYETKSGTFYRLELNGPPSTLSLPTSAPPMNVGGLHSNPLTGDMLASAGRTLYGLTLAGTKPTLSQVWTSPSQLSLASIERDPRDGTFLVATNFITKPNPVLRIDPITSAVTTVAMPGIASVNGLTIAGSRYLSAATRPEVGKAFHLRLSSPTEPGNPYVAAVSFTFKPGFAVNGRTIHLNPDALFFYSVSNSGIFSRFQGSLSAKGEAFPQILIPSMKALSGVRFYAVALTIGKGGVSKISEPVGVTIH